MVSTSELLHLFTLLQATSRFSGSYGITICCSQVLWRNMPEVSSSVELSGKSTGSPENYDQLQQKQCNSHQNLGLLMHPTHSTGGQPERLELTD